MSNHGEAWRKFVQTFFLAEQPNGYFVLNDIFRFLKEESVDDEEGSEAEGVADEAPPEPQSATPVTSAAAEPIAQPSALVTPEPVYEQAREATPAPPPVAVVEEVPVAVTPIEEALKVPEPIPEPVQAPVPILERATQTGQPNGHSSEPEVVAAPTPPTESSPRPTPPALPASSLAPSAASTTAAPTTSSHPAPAAPRSWASLAASNSKKWGPVAQVSETVAPSSSPGTGSQTPTTTTPNPSASQQHHGRPNQRSEHSPLAAAQSVTTAHCFVKVYPILIHIEMKC